MKIIGIILVLLGIVMMATRGFQFKKKEKLVEAGPIEISRTENKTVSWPIYAGGAVVILGVAVLLVSGRRR
ncbi:MAG: hypothetical protein ACXVMS_16515 [Flavisolibacter sp.]